MKVIKQYSYIWEAVHKDFTSIKYVLKGVGSFRSAITRDNIIIFLNKNLTPVLWISSKNIESVRKDATLLKKTNYMLKDIKNDS